MIPVTSCKLLEISYILIIFTGGNIVLYNYIE